jgi:tetratricopeptide (TPR) repeat protein
LPGFRHDAGISRSISSAEIRIRDVQTSKPIEPPTGRLRTAERPELAAARSTVAVAKRATRAEALSLQATLFDRAGRWDKSLACLRAAHALSPADPQLRLNLAMSLLRRGEYREGFALYEARIDKPGWSGFATRESRAALRHLMLRPGQAVDGRNILVLAEQGLGDAIMFARYLGLLRAGGARVGVACNAVIRPFFERIAGIDAILSAPGHAPFAQINLAALRFDAWVPMLSLPAWSGRFEHVGAGIPYWRPDQRRVAAWQNRFADRRRRDTIRVGLVFQANPDGASFADKSMTIDDLRPLLSLEAVDFVNLQHGPAGKALVEAAPRIIDPFPAGASLDEYAAAIAATDLVISIDTMAAHCAGAMGHATWLAVPHSPHWALGPQWRCNGVVPLDEDIPPDPTTELVRRDRGHGEAARAAASISQPERGAV